MTRYPTRHMTRTLTLGGSLYPWHSLFGSPTYVHVQKDKHVPFGSHFEKCIFLGYPDGYKGWRFYNPSTKRIVLSERAIFDERYQPGLKDWNSTLLHHPTPPDMPQDAPPSSAERPDTPSDALSVLASTTCMTRPTHPLHGLAHSVLPSLALHLRTELSALSISPMPSSMAH